MGEFGQSWSWSILLTPCEQCKELVFTQKEMESNFKQKGGVVKFVFQKESLGTVWRTTIWASVEKSS